MWCYIQWWYQTLLEAGTNHQSPYTMINKTNFFFDRINIVKLLIHNHNNVFQKKIHLHSPTFYKLCRCLFCLLKNVISVTLDVCL